MSFMTRHLAAAHSPCSLEMHVDGVDTSVADGAGRNGGAKGLRDPRRHRSPSLDEPRTTPSSARLLVLASFPGRAAVLATPPGGSGCRRPGGRCCPHPRQRQPQSPPPPLRRCPAHLRRTAWVAAVLGPRRTPTGCRGAR